ncbi:hypothetical protein KI387_035295, partial [Taxus chinensis]
FGSCYVMAIGLSLQKSDLGLPFPVMNNNIFRFLRAFYHGKMRKEDFRWKKERNQVV